ncbi:acyl-CoA dehydrogenase family protein [Rhodospirillales bacterium]|nr:acyl-CoA dehydrogenase family protein [Rhodospirillales bacterium]
MEFNITEDQQHWRDLAKDFVEKHIKPDVLRRDRLLTAEERIPWDWIREADTAGIRTLGIPKKYGGAEVDIVTLCIVGEELAVGDLGFAVIMDQCWKMAHLFGEAMTTDQQKRFIPPFVKDSEATTAIALTEPGVGSDHQGYYDEPDIDFQTTAVLDGDHYVLNGTKRYISNGSMAKLYFVVARTDKTKNLFDGGAVFIIPHDTNGFIADTFHEKSSQRLATNGTLKMENCRVPKENILLGEGKLGQLRSQFMPGSKAEAAATVLGVGRAAYEYAFDYAKNRKQGGKQIIELQTVAIMLAHIAMKLDAARLQIWKAGWLADQKHPTAPVHGLLAKVNASETAFEACRVASEVLGGASIMHEHPMEKYLRDATSFLHSDGTNQLCLLRASKAISANSYEQVFGF